MKIADGLELLKSMGREKARLESLASHDAWEYRSKDPDAKWEPAFNLEENHQRILAIDKKMRKLSRAVNATNNLQDIVGVDDADYDEWL